MFRFAIGPAIVGIIAFLLMFFIAPLIVAETDIVASVAKGTLDWSNRSFATMPPIVASYIANLNLAIVALSVGSIVAVAFLILMVVGETFVCFVRGVVSLLKRSRKKAIVRDLPPIDLTPGFRDSKPEKKILGRGFDAADETGIGNK